MYYIHTYIYKNDFYLLFDYNTTYVCGVLSICFSWIHAKEEYKNLIRKK